MFNWARSVKLCEKVQIHQPQNEQELCQLLQSRTSQKVKVMGSGMSYQGIAALDNHENDWYLDLSLLAGTVDIQGDSATFGGSTVLQNIVDTLLQNGKQLIACPGVLLTQTVAGAIATGTHGQDLKNGGIYDAVLSLSVVHADGSLKTYQKGDEGFDAFRLHLGSLGIVTSVTLQTEPMSVYRLTKALTDFDDLNRNFIAWNEASEHTKAWWFPKSDDVQLWRTFKADEEEVGLYEENGKTIYQIPDSSPVLNRKADDFSKNIDVLIEKMDHDTKSLSLTEEKRKEQDVVLNRPNARFDTVTRFRSLQHCLGNMYQLWCKGIPAPQVNCEIAIPMDKLSAALIKLRKYYHTSGKDMHYPFILRATGSSDAWLSPSYGKTVCFIGFLVYLSEDFQGNEERLQMLRDVEEVLAEFDAIPHYGKFFTRSLYPLEKRLPKYNEFKAFRAKVDPEGVFMNSFLESLLI